jgi:hypothetical protein
MNLSFKTEFPWGGPTGFIDKILGGTKIHTIRTDLGKRWQPGRTAHICTGVRTPEYKQWAIKKVVSIQRIEILWIPFSMGGLLESPVPTVYVDGRVIIDDVQLITNDGFDRYDDFYKWFKDDYKGVLIHFTDKRY